MKPITICATTSTRAGIDVAALLRDIGEATACTDPAELFRMCLDAQRVLTHVEADTAACAPGEAIVVEAYRAMTDRARHDMQAAMQAFARAFPRQRRLKLVQSGQAQTGGAA